MSVHTFIATHWTGVLDAWLAGRRAVHNEFGVRKHAGIHVLDLYNGRKTFRETPELEKQFGKRQRAATGRILLNSLSAYENFHVVVTVGTADVVKPRLYAR